MELNKKLWSFLFGCLVAGSFVWLISFGNNASIPNFLHAYPNFVFDYYPAIVTAMMAALFTMLIMIVMKIVFRVCASEHPFWLATPSFTFIIITLLASKLMLPSMLSAALPALLIMSLTAVNFRLINIKRSHQQTVLNQ